MFARIKDNNYDINGNHLYRVFIYTHMGNNQYKVISREGAKNIGIGRINKDNSITTQWNKEEIIAKLKEKANISFPSEKVLYVFE